jgi:hypothetical protein
VEIGGNGPGILGVKVPCALLMKWVLCYNLSPKLSSTFSEWFHNRSLLQLETKYSCKVVNDLMNCFPLDKNKLQPKASLDSNKQFSCKLEASN